MQESLKFTLKIPSTRVITQSHMIVQTGKNSYYTCKVCSEQFDTNIVLIMFKSMEPHTS